MKNLFRKIFNIRDPDEERESRIATAPLDGEQVETPRDDSPPRLEPEQLIVGAARSVGMQRDHNEDSLFTFTSTVATESTSVPFGLFIVADGMGGHQYGEVASETAVRSMADHIFTRLYLPVYGMNGRQPEESLQEIFTQGILETNRLVADKAPGGGTTLTAVVIIGNRMTIAHVGDSRAYAIYKDGRMQVLTRDHSLVKRLEEMGQITAEEAEVHPQKNVLYRALGQSEPFEPDVTTAPVPQPGFVLVCSDGLWGLVSDTDMYRLISEAENPHRACEALIAAANAAGGHDNISAILIRMPD
ncbi:MAG TPA: protein phosphatase 2C domain-containing protein [Anaerolineales bacterium]|nr:protein phosphatase 2C domain-containing protein [Anaerolineales bacterium]